jgi:Fic family protein
MLNQVLLLKNELDTLRPVGREQEAIIMQKFRLDWNYHSNHLEGNSLTYGETKALILFGLTAQGKPLKDHFEITGHDEAVKWIEDIVKQERPLTESFIRELHTLLLQKSYEVDAITPDGKPTKRRIEIGQYKTAPNHVLTKTGEIFRFSTPEETPAKMHDLMDWLREKQANSDIEPVLLAAEFHYRFIRIHPFDDGNGRTARLLMNFILMQYGYPPVIIKTEDKENYFNVLRLADAGNIEPFVNYIADNLSRSLEIMIKGAKGESIEDPDDLDKEIALLEQKLKGMGQKIEKEKSNDTVQEIYNFSFLGLCEKFILNAEKFNKLYLKKTAIISYNESMYDISAMPFEFMKNAFNRFGQYESNNPNKIGIIIRNEALQQLNFVNTVFLTNIFINFFDLHYSIEIFSITEDNTKFGTNRYIKKGIFELQKPYSEQLTDEEINLIVNTEMKRHTAFIEDKIKEIQAQ